MKKALRMYVAPKVEFIKMEMQSVLCASTNQPVSTNFNGTVIDFDSKPVGW